MYLYCGKALKYIPFEARGCTHESMDVEALAFRNLSLARFSSQYGWLELGPQSFPMTIWISTETAALRYSADLTVSGQSITSIADSATQIGSWHAAILAPTTTVS